MVRGPYAFAATSWYGYNCEAAMCPTGIDPQSRNAYEGPLNTAYQKYLLIIRTGVTDVQQIYCLGATNGTFRLSFRGNVSRPIPFDANADELKAFLEEIYS